MPLSALDRDRILVAKSKTTAKFIQLSEQLFGQLLEKDSLPSNELSADLNLTLQTVISDDSSVYLYTGLPRRQVWNFGPPNRASAAATSATNDPASSFSSTSVPFYVSSRNTFVDTRNGNEFVPRNTSEYFADYSSQQELPLRQTRRLPVDVRSSFQSNYRPSYQPQPQQYQPEAYRSYQTNQFNPPESRPRHQDGYGQRSQEPRSQDSIGRLLSRVHASLQPPYESQSTQSTRRDAGYQYVLDQEYRIYMANIGASTERQRPVSYSTSVDASIPIRPNAAQFTVSSASTFRTQFSQPASTSHGQVLTGEPQNSPQAHSAYQEQLSEEYRRFTRNQSMDNPPPATATQRDYHTVSSSYEPQPAPSTREQEGSTGHPLNMFFSQPSSRVLPSFPTQWSAPRIVTPEPAPSPRAASPSTWPASSWTIRTTPPPSPSRQVSPSDNVSSSTSNGNGGCGYKRKRTSDVYAVMVHIHFLKCTEKNCNKTFPSMLRLLDHRKMMHRICEARCPLLGCRFSSNKLSKLIKHRNTAHRDLTEWPCNRDDCTRSFPNQLELSDHLEMEHISGRFLCTFAGCHFESNISQQDVKNHFAVVHRGISITPPPEDASSTSPQQQANVTDDSVSGNDEEEEDVKEPAFKRAKLSEEEEEEGGSQGAQRAIPLGWRTPTPPQAATSEPSLGESAPETSFTMEYLVCLRSDCNFKSASTADWNAHMEAKHGIHPYRCPMVSCLASFTQSHQLAEHMESAHGNVPIWQCHCQAEFATASQLSEHLTVEHFGGLFTCTVYGCSFQEKTRGLMMAHFETEHASGGHSNENDETIQVKEEYFSAGEEENNSLFVRRGIPQEAGNDSHEEKVAI